MWRPRTRDGVTFYAAAYRHEHGEAALLRSTNGREWERVSTIMRGRSTDETDVIFLSDGRLLAVSRVEGEAHDAWRRPRRGDGGEPVGSVVPGVDEGRRPHGPPRRALPLRVEGAGVRGRPLRAGAPGRSVRDGLDPLAQAHSALRGDAGRGPPAWAPAEHRGHVPTPAGCCATARSSRATARAAPTATIRGSSGCSRPRTSASPVSRSRRSRRPPAIPPSPGRDAKGALPERSRFRCKGCKPGGGGARGRVILAESSRGGAK